MISYGIVAITGWSFISIFVVACSVVFGIPIALVQIGKHRKSALVDRLMTWYLFSCCWIYMALLAVGTFVMVSKLFHA